MKQKIKSIISNVNTTMRKKWVFDAIRAGQVNKLPLLIKSPDEFNWSKSIVDHGCKIGISLIDEAIAFDQMEVLAWLLENGADPSITFHFDQRINPETFREHGFYFCPLLRAVRTGNVMLISYLIGKGASLDVPTLILPGIRRSVGQYIADDPKLVACLALVDEWRILDSSIETKNMRMPSMAL